MKLDFQCKWSPLPQRAGLFLTPWLKGEVEMWVLRVRQQDKTRSGAFWWLQNPWIMRGSLAPAEWKDGILWIIHLALFRASLPVSGAGETKPWSLWCVPKHFWEWFELLQGMVTPPWPVGTQRTLRFWGTGKGWVGWSPLPCAASRNIQKRNPRDSELDQQQEPVSEGENIGEIQKIHQ